MINISREKHYFNNNQTEKPNGKHQQLQLSRDRYKVPIGPSLPHTQYVNKNKYINKIKVKDKQKANMYKFSDKLTGYSTDQYSCDSLKGWGSTIMCLEHR